METPKCKGCGSEDMVRGYMWSFRMLPVWACEGGCHGCQEDDWNFLQSMFFDFFWFFRPEGEFPIDTDMK